MNDIGDVIFRIARILRRSPHFSSVPDRELEKIAWDVYVSVSGAVISKILRYEPEKKRDLFDVLRSYQDVEFHLQHDVANRTIIVEAFRGAIDLEAETVRLGDKELHYHGPDEVIVRSLAEAGERRARKNEVKRIGATET